MTTALAHEKIQGIWSQVLGIPSPSITDNFFTLGGSSMQAFDIMERTNREFQTDLTIMDFFEVLTISGLAELIVTKNN